MKIKSLSLLILGLVMIALLIYLSISINKDSVLDNKKDVRVQLQWFHGAQFAGLYVAQEKGYFLDEGIRVKLNQLSTYTSDPIAILTAGNTDIALSSADQVLINKDNGKEIKAIGTVYNRSLACYVYKKSPEVDTFRLENLRGKKIGVYKKFDTENILLALDLKNKLNLLKKGHCSSWAHRRIHPR